MRRIGALIPTIAVAAGIAVSSLAGLAWGWGAALIAVATTMYVLMIRLSSDPVQAFRIGKYHIIWVALLFAGIGALDENLNRPLTLSDAFGENVPSHLSAEVISVLPKTYGDRLEVELYGTNGARARILTGATTLRHGDIVIIPSSLLRPVLSDTSSVMIKLAPMFKSKGILYSAFIPSKSITFSARARSFRSFCSRIRNVIEIKVENSRLQKNTAAFLKAILMGDKHGLDEETRLTFVNGGMAHMLALSGLHMGILAGLLLWLLWPLRVLGRYKWGYALTIMLLWGYVFLTGLSHSSVRAGIMITIALLALIIERKNSVAHALCIACMLILLVTPSAIFDAGFQLSFVCVAALISFASRLNPIDRRRHPRLYAICGVFLATMVATAASWPLTSYYFNQIPLMFLPTNVLLLPVLPFYLCLGVIFTTLLCCGIEFKLLGHILDCGYNYLLSATDFLSGGDAYILPYQIPLILLILYFSVLSFLAYILYKKSHES